MQAVALAAIAVAAVVYCGVYLAGRGLYGETGFVELSQTRPWWDGFVYPHDPMRRFLSLPMHVGYLTSNGSYGSLNAWFVFSVFATGALTFRIVRLLAPPSLFLAFAAGVIATAHGADRMANFVPGIQVRSGVVFGLAAVLLFLHVARDRRLWLVLPMAAAQWISLWTYEPVFPPLLFVPLLVLAFPAERRWAWRAIALWLVVPGVYVLSLLRYLTTVTSSYQAGRVDGNLSPLTFASNLASIVGESVAFWQWPLRWLALQAADCVGSTIGSVALPAVIGAVVVAIGAGLIARHGRDGDKPPLTKVFAGGVIFAVLAAAPFAIVSNVWNEGGAWRTQFYLAIPSALLLAVAVAAIARRSAVLGVAALTVVTGCGFVSGLIGQRIENARWLQYRSVMGAIVQTAPRLQQDSLVVMTGVPPAVFSSMCPSAAAFDPFSGEQLWLNSGLQVLYPETRLVGLYWTTAGTRPGSIDYRFDESGATLVKSSTSVEGERFGYDQMLAFAFDPARGAVLLDRFPAADIPGSVESPLYAPRRRIGDGPPPVETTRKLN